MFQIRNRQEQISASPEKFCLELEALSHMRLALAILSVTLAGSAWGQMLQDMGPPQHRLVHRQLVVLRVNPLGLLYDGRFSYRFRLYQSDSTALRDNFVGIGLAPGASPAFARIGAYAEVQPAS